MPVTNLICLCVYLRLGLSTFNWSWYRSSWKDSTKSNLQHVVGEPNLHPFKSTSIIEVILQNLVPHWLDELPCISLCNMKWVFCCGSDFNKYYHTWEYTCPSKQIISLCNFLSLTTVIISS